MNSNGKRVLITGASIAGPTLAYWLDEAGYTVSVVERSPSLRTGGQNIDIRGPAREVIRRMGLEATLLAHTTTEQGTRFVDRHGSPIAEFPAGSGDRDGLTAELEVLRGQLARILVDSSGTHTEYRFGDYVTDCKQDTDGVDVTFAAGGVERYDFVFFADGVRSRSRDLVFSGEAEKLELGLYNAYGVIPRSDDDDSWWRWFNAPGARVVGLRPDNVGSTRFNLSWLSAPQEYENAEPADVIDALGEIFGDAGWQAARILGAGAELYVDYLTQIRSPRWSRGRIALVGDAAWCATPLSGMGTTLAITGAYVLAGELATSPDHQQAFASYDALMRPFVEQAQDLPPGTPRAAHPKSRAAVALLNTALRLAGSKPIRTLGSALLSPAASTLELPTYGTTRG